MNVLQTVIAPDAIDALTTVVFPAVMVLMDAIVENEKIIHFTYFVDFRNF